MSDDGRLDLDELGSVIESASTIDQPRDVVGDDTRTTWGERLESAGITPWIRGHRVALAIGTVAVVAVGIGGTAWQRAQPPPWHDVAITAAAASVDEYSGPGMTFSEDGIVLAAYLMATDDPSTTVRVEALEGPGIRASTVGAPHPNGNQAAALVRALVDCGGDVPAVTSSDYHLRVRATDAFGRSREETVAAPSGDNSWPQVVMQLCLQTAVFSDIELTGLRTAVDQGAGAVRLELDLASALPVSAQAQLDSIDNGELLLPYDAGSIQLEAGGTGTLTGSVQVRDCSTGAPALPTVTVPVDPQTPNSYRGDTGVGVFIVTPDRAAGALKGLLFDDAQSAELSRALAEICRGAPKVSVSDLSVVRTTDDTTDGSTSFTFSVRADVAGSRVMKVGVSQDPAFGTPDPGLVPWSTLPAGGGTTDVTWTFSCQSYPQPPSLDVRFVDGIRATPLRVPLDQKTIAAALYKACPLLSPATLAEQGWTFD
jgi:hypothetical protein